MKLATNERQYDIDGINGLIRDKKNIPKPKYSLFDQILLLLYADMEYAIHGKTRFMKEIFLAQHEVFKLEEIAPVIFIQYKFGPYNDAVENLVDDMVFSNYILLTKTAKPPKEISVMISDKGKDHAAPQFKNLPSEMQSTLKEKRREWDTSADILNYVYTHYKKYLRNSELKERHASIDWEDDPKSDRK